MKQYIYFRTYAKELGCPVDDLGDLAVWNFILRHQGKPEIKPPLTLAYPNNHRLR